MTIIHLSYVRVKSSEPNKWLDEIDFFTGILNELSKDNIVKSIHCLHYTGVVKQRGVEYHFLKRNFFQLIFPWSLHVYAKNLKPEIIVVHGLHWGWQILWLKFQIRKGIKIFVQHHAEKPQRFPKDRIQQLADLFIQGYFFVSRQMALPWVKANQIKSTDKIHEIMEASSTFFSVDRIESRKRTNVSGNLIYLWVGRMDENKDPTTLVRAFKRFSLENPSARLYIISKGGHLEKQIVELVQNSSQIICVGSIVHHDLLYWFNSSDFIISTSHYEGSGIAVCEAMSCGCIPILTNIPSFNWMTNDQECGILYSPGDEGELHRALEASLLLDREAQHNKTRQLFESNLSFTAIANRMLAAVKR